MIYKTQTWARIQDLLADKRQKAERMLLSTDPHKDPHAISTYQETIRMCDWLETDSIRKELQETD